MIKMKCELKYVVHDQIKAFTGYTLKELLITIPVAILTVLFLIWCDLERNVLLVMLIIAVVADLCISSVSAIRFCKSKKE